jgi:hypothetical protein
MLTNLRVRSSSRLNQSSFHILNLPLFVTRFCASVNENNLGLDTCFCSCRTKLGGQASISVLDMINHPAGECHSDNAQILLQHAFCYSREDVSWWQFDDPTDTKRRLVDADQRMIFPIPHLPTSFFLNRHSALFSFHSVRKGICFSNYVRLLLTL